MNVHQGVPFIGPAQVSCSQIELSSSSHEKHYVSLSNKSFQHVGLSLPFARIIVQCIYNLNRYDFFTFNKNNKDFLKSQ